MTATFFPSRLFNKCVKTVVFPAPRKPDNTVTGNFCIMLAPCFNYLVILLQYWQEEWLYREKQKQLK